MLPFGDQVEAPPNLGLGLGELSPSKQRLAQGPMGQGELRFEPDGLAEVVDGFLQSGLVLRGNAERVPGRGPLGVTVVSLPVISDRPVPGVTAEGAEGFHALWVAVVHLVPPALCEQGDAEQVVGPGTIGIELQGLPVVVDRLVEGSRTGQDFAEVAMGGGQPGIDLQGVPVHEHRRWPIALDFQGHAEVVEARGEPGIVLHHLMKDGNGPGPPPSRSLSHIQYRSYRTTPKSFRTATACGRISRAFS